MKYIAVMFLLISGLIFAQDNGKALTVGEVVISPGMNTTDVLKSFGKNISVSVKTTINETIYIVQQHEQNSSGYKVCGQFSSVDGKITSVTKYWGTYSTENFSKGLFDLYRLLSNSGGIKYYAYPDDKADEKAKDKSIIFRYNNRSFFLNVSEYGFTLAENLK